MSTTAPLRARADLWRALTRGIDRPAREALELARKPVVFTLAPALLGLFLVALASTAASLVDPARAGAIPRFDVLRAALEALGVMVPAIVVFGTYLRLRLTPSALLAGCSLGLLVAGVVSLALVPMIAFLALVSTLAPTVLSSLSLLVPAIALAAAAAVFYRVVEGSDRSARATYLARAYALGLLAVFAIRALPLARGLFEHAGYFVKAMS
jgi:hypothetical protein